MLHWCKTSRLYLVPAPNYWTWTKTTPSLVKSLWNWGFNNFSHWSARVTKLTLHDHIYNIIWVTWWNSVAGVIDRDYDVIAVTSNYLYFNRVYSSHLCWHHQNCNGMCHVIYVFFGPSLVKVLIVPSSIIAGYV